MDKSIEKFALANAVKFKGKANPGSIMGMLFKEDPNLKKKAKEVSKKVQEIIKKVNSMSLEEQETKLKKLAPELLEDKKEKKKKGLPELKVKGEMVTRIPPEPSKHLHFGHAMSFLINFMYAQRYKGKCVLRFDDTNPEKVKKEYFKSIEEDLKWLGIKVDKKVIASEHMELFYKLAEKLIKKGDAYVCSCEREMMKQYREEEKICDHRETSARENLETWKDMLKGKYNPGEIVLRLKGAMDSPNATMRDPVIFRISKAKHDLQDTKYNVWPMYDFESAVAEDLTGVTHIFRSNEFGKMRIELQDYMKDLLGLSKQETIQYGRITIKDKIASGRQIREMLEKGEVTGWDDPRLVTVKSLRRRGIRPETFQEVFLEAGMSSTETNLDWSVIASINRKLIDPDTKRFFFVIDPKKVKVKHDLKNVKVPNHPSNEKMGKRTLELGEEFYVQDKIAKSNVYRFMHLFNFKDGKFVSEEYDQKLKAKIVHTVPVNDSIDVQVLMDDGSLVKGKGEKALSSLKEGEVIQFERFAFCRLDNKKEMLFIYSHD
jgi:glutamyl-tRNA synthetase